MASFGVFGSYLIIETSQEWGRILWNPWQCKLKLKYMKYPSFGALHSPLLSQSEIQGRKPEEEIQQLAFSHGCAKFHTPCEIFLCTNFVRFLSPDILCNFLFSHCNQLRYFLLYLFIYLVCVPSFGKTDMWFFIKHL